MLLSANAAAEAAPSTIQVVLMGIITVFIVLVCLIAIIKILGLIMKAVSGKGEAAPAPAAPVPVPAAPAVQPDKQQLVAAISAAIAEDMGTDVSHLKIHSIRRL